MKIFRPFEKLQNQINSLITNVFNAILEELQELKVNVSEQPSSIIKGFIENVDYDHNFFQ